MITLLHGDCIDLLRTITRRVQCIVTSPPYFGLRDYGLPPTLWPTVEYAPMAGLLPIRIQGCESDCAHEWGQAVRGPFANTASGPNGRKKNTKTSHNRPVAAGAYCQRCGGWRGCLGLEPDPLMFIAHLVHVFRLARAVLADDGVCWLNLGDTYAAGGNGGGGSYMALRARQAWEHRADRTGFRSPPAGLKEKDLLGIPWRAALALQADGWYLRSDIIWAKPNAMPESTKDRPTKAHEYLFLLSKSEKYYYDQAAIREPQTGNAHSRGKGITPKSVPAGDGRIRANASFHASTATYTEVPGGRNRRSVWTIAARGISDAHFATFPEALVEPCILAGSRPGDMVLDMFHGSGTVGRVAERFGRDSIGIDLNADYIELQERRTDGLQIEMEAYL